MAEAGSQPFVIEHTADGGQTWQQSSVPTGAELRPPDPSVTLATPLDIGLTGSSGSWILGFCGGVHRRSIEHRNDTVWLQLLGNPPLQVESDLHITSRRHVLQPNPRVGDAPGIPVSKPGLASAERVVVLASHDGGKTWVVRNRNVTG